MSQKKWDRIWIRRGLMAEHLEPRAMLAGDVDVFVRGSTLFVRGDGDDNQVAIAQIDDGVYAVVGLNGTSINNNDEEDEDGPVFVSDDDGFVTNIDVSLGRGDDLLAVGNDVESLVGDFADFDFLVEEDFEIDTEALEQQLDDAEAPEDFELDGFLKIVMGDGNDAVAMVANGDGGIGSFVFVDLGKGTNGFNSDEQTDDEESEEEGNQASIGGSLTVRAGSGSDEVNIDETDIGGSLLVLIGDGGNDVDVDNSNIAGNATVITGRHVDTIDFFGGEIQGSLSINSGSGDDSIGIVGNEVDGNLLINSGAGDDVATVEFSEVGGLLKITTGAGSDAAGVFDAFAGTLIVSTGAGIDVLRVEFVDVLASAVIDAGSGNDSSEEEVDVVEAAAGVYLFDLEVDAALTVLLGSGHDTLEAESVVVHGSAVLNAGSGDDLVEIDASEVDGVFTAIMGSGRDELFIFGSIAGNIGLNGGSGTDRLETDIDEDDESVLYIISFELPDDEEDEEDEV